MCEQCCASTICIGELVPGWFLVLATKDGAVMKAGNYGLLRINDPDFIFTVKPVKDKFYHLSDEEINHLPLVDFLSNTRKLGEVHYSIYDSLKCSPEIGYKLYCSCIKTGYKEDDDTLEYWLINKMGQMIEEWELSGKIPYEGVKCEKRS